MNYDELKKQQHQNNMKQKVLNLTVSMNFSFVLLHSSITIFILID